MPDPATCTGGRSSLGEVARRRRADRPDVDRRPRARHDAGLLEWFLAQRPGRCPATRARSSAASRRSARRGARRGRGRAPGPVRVSGTSPRSRSRSSTCCAASRTRSTTTSRSSPTTGSMIDRSLDGSRFATATGIDDAVVGRHARADLCEGRCAQAALLTASGILVTGGTRLARARCSSGGCSPASRGARRVIRVLARRGEAARHAARVPAPRAATDEIDLLNYDAACRSSRSATSATTRRVQPALADADVVFNAAAMKQVPTCEYFPFEAVQHEHRRRREHRRAIRAARPPVETVVGISTDKACKPGQRDGDDEGDPGAACFVQARTSTAADTRFVLRALRQRARLARLGHPAVPRPDPRTAARVTITTRGDDAVPAQPRARRST